MSIESVARRFGLTEVVSDKVETTNDFVPRPESASEEGVREVDT